MDMTFRFCCVPFPATCPGLHTSITLPTAPTTICTTCAFLVFHMLEISLSSSWYSLFIVFVYIYLFICRNWAAVSASPELELVSSAELRESCHFPNLWANWSSFQWSVGLVRRSSQFPDLTRCILALADPSGQLCLMVSALPAPCPCPVLILFDR